MVQSSLRRQRRRIDLWSARVESYLTTRAFLILFLCGYICLVGLFFFWGFYKQFHRVTNNPEALPCDADDTCNVMRYFLALARAGGVVLDLTTALVIFFAAKLLFTIIRETPLQLVLPLDDSFPFFHVVVGCTIVAAVVVHGTFHTIWLIGWDGWGPDLSGINLSILTGFLLTIDFFVMLVFARKKERRGHFRRFHIVHVVGAVIFFALLFAHDVFFTEPQTYKYILGPVVIYIIDRGIRHFRTKTSKVSITNDDFALKGNGILFLKFPKQFKYRAGQYAELMVPAINREWHPFTIASAPHEEEMHFFIKTVGDWTNALERLLKDRLENPEANQEPLSIRVMGPYGAPAQHVRSYHRVILVSGGVGSTPFSSICKHLHHLQIAKEKPVAENSRTDTVALHNINRRLLEKLADLYDMDFENLCKAVAEEEVLIRGHHLVRMASMLAAQESETTILEGNELAHENTTQSGGKPDVHENTSPQITNHENGDSSQTESSLVFSATSFDETESDLMQHVGSVFYDIASPNLVNRKSVKSPQDISGSVARLQKEKQEKKLTFKARLNSLSGKRAALLAFAHTTRVSFSLLLSLLIRGTLICIGLIIGTVSLNTGVEFEQAAWLITIDTILGILLACQVTGTVLLELSYMGKRFFGSKARVFDLILLVPLVILSIAYGIRAWVGDQKVAAWYIIVHFFVVLPVLFLLLGYRLYRSVGSHTLMRNAPSAGKHKKIIPAVDFMWTTPYDDDDKWLRETLNPLASGSELRLHRFVTRAGEHEVSQEEGYISSTRTGRPQWDELIRQVTLETPSNKEIGVFFCGPKPMGSALEKSLRRNEILSNLRGAYLHASSRRTLVSDLQLKSVRTIDLLKSTGCNIRFVYREENFGY